MCTSTWVQHNWFCATHTCVHAHTYACSCTCVCMHTHTHAHMHECACTHTHTHMHAWVRMHTHTHTCMHECACTHTHFTGVKDSVVWSKFDEHNNYHSYYDFCCFRCWYWYNYMLYWWRCTLCVCVCERERVCVCVCMWERERSVYSISDCNFWQSIGVEIVNGFEPTCGGGGVLLKNVSLLLLCFKWSWISILNAKF